MSIRIAPGLGELLRYLAERVDQGADEHYSALNINYRARYTPILRALRAGAVTVTDITDRTHLTQGAISQTIGLMVADGIITRESLADGRKSGLGLTHRGRELLKVLEPLWERTFAALHALEAEIGYPLLRVLEATATALEQQDFAARLTAAKNLRRRGR
jgi:DNA-binding MarR family transcriptional regulator